MFSLFPGWILVCTLLSYSLVYVHQRKYKTVISGSHEASVLINDRFTCCCRTVFLS